MMYLWSDEQNLFSLTDKTNLVEMQRQIWQQAITAAGTARSWCELKPDMKYTMKTSNEVTEDLYKDRRRIVPDATQSCSVSGYPCDKRGQAESEREVKFDSLSQ